MVGRTGRERHIGVNTVREFLFLTCKKSPANFESRRTNMFSRNSLKIVVFPETFVVAKAYQRYGEDFKKGDVMEKYYGYTYGAAWDKTKKLIAKRVLTAHSRVSLSKRSKKRQQTKMSRYLLNNSRIFLVGSG